MAKDKRCAGVARHIKACGLIIALVLGMSPLAVSQEFTTSVNDEVLDILSWGGAYERAQRRALFEPFTRATGTPVRVHRYNGGLSELRRGSA